MHRVLASAGMGDRAFGPEPMSPFQVRALYQSIRGRVRLALELLEARQAPLPPRDAHAAAAVIALRHVSRRCWPASGTSAATASASVSTATCISAMLDTGDDVVFIDFEGDTARPLSERRLRGRPWPTSPLVRSFHFAAHWPRSSGSSRRRDEPGGRTSPHGPRSGSAGSRRPASRAIAKRPWARPSRPSDDEAWSVLFGCLLVSRASGELTKRLGSRSDWLGIPLAGLDELLGPREKECGAVTLDLNDRSGVSHRPSATIRASR